MDKLPSWQAIESSTAAAKALPLRIEELQWHGVPSAEAASIALHEYTSERPALVKWHKECMAQGANAPALEVR